MSVSVFKNLNSNLHLMRGVRLLPGQAGTLDDVDDVIENETDRE